jgi:membrane associated rhomboid family serine protease
MSMDDLFCHLSEQTARTYSLVLSATGIPHQRIRLPEGWQISVPESHRFDARQQIEQYLIENPPETERGAANDPVFQKTFSAAWVAWILLAIHVAKEAGNPGKGLVRTFGASAEPILNGELYRCLTALMLHADAVHLMGNLVGIGLFGTALCAMTGAGAGWAMILFSGVSGNLLNALLQGSSPLSIGASTAIFGALGSLSILALKRKPQLSARPWQALLPLGGGIALLGLLGSAEGTDVLAHLLGFLSGIAVAIPWAMLIRTPPARKVQMFIGGLSLAAVLWAWRVGYAGSLGSLG